MHPIPGGDTNLLQSRSTKFTSSPLLIIPHSSLSERKEDSVSYFGVRVSVSGGSSRQQPASVRVPQSLRNRSCCNKQTANLSVCPPYFVYNIDNSLLSLVIYIDQNGKIH